jgi:hypothetical protein
MNKTVVLVVVIMSSAIVAGIHVWSLNNRYHMVTGMKGIVYEVDARTGKSWVLIGASKTLHEPPKPEKKKILRPLPHAESAKITGNGSFGFGSFSGKLYNGSTWNVARIKINVTATENSGSIRWSRDFVDEVAISPLEVGDFYVQVTGEQGIKNVSWFIKEIHGYPERKE